MASAQCSRPVDTYSVEGLSEMECNGGVGIRSKLRVHTDPWEGQAHPQAGKPGALEGEETGPVVFTALQAAG